jgi:predicted helicase
MESEPKVEKTLAELLAEFRATATSDSDKGTKFERLTKFYLIKDPIWSEQLANVRLREEAGIGPDVGIDLVADDIASGGKVAIQCKFYDEKTYLDDLGTFYTSSGKDGYVKRIVVTTSNQWTRNAEQALKNQQIPVQRILLHDMEQSLISWGAFDLSENYGSIPIAQKELRPHQLDALTAVMDGFKESDRGKVIMACGTGKTLVSLRIAEEFFKQKKAPSTVLFLAPSISLLSQTIMEWGQNKKSPYMALAVCSDAKVGKKDDDDMQVTDLAIPASTDVEKLSAALANRGTKNLVIFSTYQSLEIISKAQNGKKNPLSEFDLVVCDEAHRTTGVTTAAKVAVEDFSHFVRIHDNSYVKASKRLYMTATPKIYKDVDNKVAESGGVIASMDDPEKFGEEFYRLGFGTAVERGLLSDYRVLILAVDEEYVARLDLERFRSEDSTINLDDASKLLGCWRGLSKIKTQGEDVDSIPMKRAVAFANTIDASQVLAKRLEIVGRTANRPTEGNQGLSLQTKHVDGKQNALVRRQNLEWLKADPGPQTARILTNARCLSEGIDVPALDAVIFIEARGSQVDIVQAVGRVMRKYDGKNCGYIILPVAITAGADIDSTLKGTKYKVIWDVLNALRAHDDRFDVIVNQINLNQDRDSKIEVEVITGDDDEDVTTAEEFEQGVLVHLPSQIADGIYAKIVEKVGERDYWEKWAKGIAEIARDHTTRLKAIVDKSSGDLRSEFERFLTGLRDNLNPSITEHDALEMLSQHLITRPVFDALFDNYAFSESNPVSQVMQGMIDALKGQNLEAETEKLEKFYASVRLRASGVTDSGARQHIVKELYEKFFRTAFADTSNRLGIVYTPNEIVDFMVHSVNEALRLEFGTSIREKGVHILDPFTGTGTFIVRLLQSGILSGESLRYKYLNEIHANELVLLAYYVAAINIEETYHSLSGDTYTPFQGIVLTDTFQMTEKDDSLDGLGVFPENNERVKSQLERDIRVIIGNPPYSVGQTTANDNNANLKYPTLDARIGETYVKNTDAKSLQKLYDSYIRSIRWATDRLGDEGVICFVTNGGFIDSATASGVRRVLLDEFDSVYIFNLRGNAKGSGERRRKERDNVFGEGTKTTVVISLLIKKKGSSEKQGKLFYHDIGDYLTKPEKLARIKEFGNYTNLPWLDLVPNQAADWINQRDQSLSMHPVMGSKDKNAKEETRYFKTYSLGLVTNRDSWAYNFNPVKVDANIERLITNYNAEVSRKISAPNSFSPDMNPKQISWSEKMRKDLEKGIKYTKKPDRVFLGSYRPFLKAYVYFEKDVNGSVFLLPKMFPSPATENPGICIQGGEFAALMVNSVPDMNFFGFATQFFPRYTFLETHESTSEQLFRLDNGTPGVVDNISDEMLQKCRSAFGEGVTKDDIFHYVYGVLYSPEYRELFGANISKEIPRIPLSRNFHQFAEIGKSLGNLHVNYEGAPLMDLEVVGADSGNYGVEKMKYAKNKGVTDKTSIIVNSSITVRGIPLGAQDFRVGPRSALDWLIDRYQVKTDSASGITSDPNEFGESIGNASYILDLIQRVTHVSVETVRLTSKMPPLDILG